MVSQYAQVAIHYHRPGGLNKNIFIINLKAWKSKIKALMDPVSGEGLLSDL